MKYSDLKVGEHYYYVRSNWAWDNAHDSGDDVILLEAQKYRRQGSSFYRRYVADSKGRYVKVQFSEEEGSVEYVLPGALRGPTAEVKEALARRGEEREREREERNQKYRANGQLVADTRALAITAGLGPVRALQIDEGGATFEVDARLLHDFLAKVEAERKAAQKS